MGNLNKNTVRFRMENKAGLNVNEEIQARVKICAWLCEMSLWSSALWQSSFDLLEAPINAKCFQMERKIVLLFLFFFFIRMLM